MSRVTAAVGLYPLHFHDKKVKKGLKNYLKKLYLNGEGLSMRLIKTKKYLKSLKLVEPMKEQDKIEAAVDRLEEDMTGVERIKGSKDQARLAVGNYRVHLKREKDKQITILMVEDVVRRTTTTYKHRK